MSDNAGSDHIVEAPQEELSIREQTPEQPVAEESTALSEAADAAEVEDGTVHKTAESRSDDSGSGGSSVPAPAAPPAPEEYRIDYGRAGGIEPYVDRSFRDFAHENGISGELAQKLVDFNNRLEAVRKEDHRYQVEEWAEKTRTMPGWQGRNYERNMSIAGRAMQAFVSPELAELIRSSGYGNHPEVLKTFYAVGKRLSEDSYVDSTRNTPRRKTIGEVLYPDQPV